VYAAQRSSDQAMTVMVVNKTTGDLTSPLDIAGLPKSATAQVFQYGQADPTKINRLADQTLAGGQASMTFPAYSITELVIPAVACHVTYTKQSEWRGGFVAEATIGNIGTKAVNGWTLTFGYPGDQQITKAWNAQVTQNGTAVTAKNLSYDGVIKPGSHVSFGIKGTWDASDAPPTSFAVNSVACD